MAEKLAAVAAAPVVAGTVLHECKEFYYLHVRVTGLPTMSLAQWRFDVQFIDLTSEVIAPKYQI